MRLPTIFEPHLLPAFDFIIHSVMQGNSLQVDEHYYATYNGPLQEGLGGTKTARNNAEC